MAYIKWHLSEKQKEFTSISLIYLKYINIDVQDKQDEDLPYLIFRELKLDIGTHHLSLGVSHYNNPRKASG